MHLWTNNFPAFFFGGRGLYEGPEPDRLAALKYAAILGADYVDIELRAAKIFFAGKQTWRSHFWGVSFADQSRQIC